MHAINQQLVEQLSSLPSWLSLSITFLCFAIVLGFLKSLLQRLLFGFTTKTSVNFDSILLQSARRPLSLAVLVGAAWLAELTLQALDIISNKDNPKLALFSLIGIVIGIVLFTDQLIRLWIAHYQSESDLLRSSGNLVKGTLRCLTFVVGALVLLSTLGISITPILASLGIGSLAVALALQPTLENFFSGIQILADKPIRVGDYIELSSGEQGFVEKIGWRSVWIKMLPNNIVIIPNSELAKSKVINYFYPEKQLSVPVECSVHYDSDLEFVEKVALDVARKILVEHEWGVEDYDTFVVFHTFDSSSINFTVMLRAKEYFNRFFIKSAFIKALHKRFKQEGIVIPYPINAINLSQEKAETCSPSQEYPIS